MPFRHWTCWFNVECRTGNVELWRKENLFKFHLWALFVPKQSNRNIRTSTFIIPCSTFDIQKKLPNLMSYHFFVLHPPQVCSLKQNLVYPCLPALWRVILSEIFIIFRKMRVTAPILLLQKINNENYSFSLKTRRLSVKGKKTFHHHQSIP